jgi:hypothetical protein
VISEVWGGKSRMEESEVIAKRYGLSSEGGEKYSNNDCDNNCTTL